MKRILIVKTSALGDVTLALEILPHLKALAPSAKIDWVCEAASAPLLKSCPLIDNVIEIDSKQWRGSFFAHRREIRAALCSLRKNRYDLVFDLQGNTKSGLITFFSRSNCKVGYGKKCVAEWLNLLATNLKFNPELTGARADLIEVIYAAFGKEVAQLPPEKSRVFFTLTAEEEKHIEGIKTDNTIVVCPQSFWANKRFKRKTLSLFLRLIQERYGCSFLISWKTPIERINSEKTAGEIGPAATLLPPLSAAELFSVMASSLGVITVDSFPLHLAAFTEKPSFSVFGPSLGTYYKPKGALHAHFQGECPYSITFEKRCPILRSCQTGSCMRQIDAIELFTAFRQSPLGKLLIPIKYALETQ